MVRWRGVVRWRGMVRWRNIYDIVRRRVCNTVERRRGICNMFHFRGHLKAPHTRMWLPPLFLTAVRLGSGGG